LSEFESNKLACDEDNAEALMNQGFQFEQMSCSVMSECYRKFDRKDWTKILTAPRPMVNNMNLIELAKNISADNFIAESPIQSYLNHTWMGQIHHSTSMLKILLCFIPPLFLLLRYNKRNMSSEDKQAWERKQQKKMRKKGFVLLFCIVLCCVLLCCVVSSFLVSSRFVLSRLVLSCLVASRLVSSRLVSSRLVLSCLVLCCVPLNLLL
jgi:hypothetical protein